MARNVQKQAEIGRQIIRKHPRADMTASEMQQLFAPLMEKKCDYDTVWDVITTAYLMGIAVGNRIEK